MDKYDLTFYMVNGIWYPLLRKNKKDVGVMFNYGFKTKKDLMKAIELAKHFRKL